MNHQDFIKMKAKSILIILVLLMVQTTLAQRKTRADRYFEKGDFIKAAEYYEAEIAQERHKKAIENKKKHGVSFEEAKSIFYDELAIQFYDYDNSESEDRFIMLGISKELNVLTVCHCERQEGEIIRIISARKATKNERKFYEGGSS